MHKSDAYDNNIIIFSEKLNVGVTFLVAQTGNAHIKNRYDSYCDGHRNCGKYVVVQTPSIRHTISTITFSIHF